MRNLANKPADETLARLKADWDKIRNAQREETPFYMAAAIQQVLVLFYDFGYDVPLLQHYAMLFYPEELGTDADEPQFFNPEHIIAILELDTQWSSPRVEQRPRKCLQ